MPIQKAWYRLTVTFTFGRSGTAARSEALAATTTNANIAGGKRRSLPNDNEAERENEADDNDNTMFLLTV